MEISNRNLKIIGSGLVLAGATVYVIWNQSDKKSKMEKLLTYLGEGTDETGTITDLGTYNAKTQYSAQPFRADYWPRILNTYKSKGYTLYTTDQAATIAKNLKSYMGTVANEDKILAVFKQFKNKGQVSQVTDQYNRYFKLDLLTELTKLDTATDKLLGKEILPTLQQIVTNLPG